MCLINQRLIYFGNISDEWTHVLLLPLEHASIVGHGIAQLTPEQWIAPLEIGVELEIGAQLAIDALEVFQLLVQDNYDAFAFILQRRLVGNAELHARPNGIDEMLREHNYHTLRVVNGAHNLLGNAVADEPIAAMEANTKGVQATLQLGQQLGNQLFVLVRIGDEGIVGLVLVQLLLGYPPEAKIVIVEPYLELLLIDKINHTYQTDDNHEATQNAANEQNIRGAQLAHLHLLEWFLWPAAAVNITHILDTLRLCTHKSQQRQGGTITAQWIATHGQIHCIICQVIDKVLIKYTNPIPTHVQQAKIARQLFDTIQANQQIIGKAQFTDIGIADDATGFRQLANAIIFQLEGCLYQRCLWQQWQLLHRRSPTVYKELQRFPLHPANALRIAFPIRRLVLANVIVGAHQRLKGHPEFHSIELGTAHIDKVQTAHVPKRGRIQRGQRILIEHQSRERCQHCKKFTVDQCGLVSGKNKYTQ